MKARQKTQSRHKDKARAVKEDNQRKRKRRERECEGYTYIEMVGWIDRREKCRRNDDRFNE